MSNNSENQFSAGFPEDSNQSIDTPRAISPGRALEPSEAAPPPKRSRHARNRLVSSSVFLTLAALVVLFFGNSRFHESGPLETPRTILVKEGYSLSTIAQQLETRGIIDSDLLFRMGVRAYRASAQMRVGEYAFKPAMSMYDVMQTLRQGKGVIHKVSIPEGLT